MSGISGNVDDAGRRALNDNEVNHEIKKMLTFIKQEAIEKAREIRAKADEEFNIEKAKLVRQEAINIEANFLKKEKRAIVEKKVQQSAHSSRAKLRLLKHRESFLDDLIEETFLKMKSIAENTSVYETLLCKLILECMFFLSEDNVLLMVRRQDTGLVESLLEGVSERYRNETNKELTVSVIKNKFLYDTCSGGVIGFSKDMKIKCDNTFDTRLSLLTEKSLPKIREIIMGVSANRRFFD